MLLALLLPLVDLALLFRLGEAVGAGWVVLFVIASAMIGVAVARRAGLRALADLRRAVDGTAPDEGALGPLLRLAAGLLWMIPGAISDALGLALLIPPVRRWAAGRLRARFERGVAEGRVHVHASVVRFPPDGWDAPPEPALPDRKTPRVIDAEFEVRD